MRTAWKIISGLFRGIWALVRFIREFIVNVLLFLFIGVVVVAYWQSHPSAPTENSKGALLMDLSGVVVDTPSFVHPINQYLTNRQLQENSLFELVETLRAAKEDDNITGLVLSLNNFLGTDLSSLQYIAKALKEFQAAGKPIYAIGDSYSQGQYYLASVADKIYLSPQGMLDLRGIATNGLYYKSLLEKLQVSTHVFRVGKFKSAVEPFLRDDMSPEARDADSRWVNGLWGQYADTIVQNRQIPADLFPSSAANMLTELAAYQGDMAKYALEHKLVDVLASRHEIEQELIKQFGWDKENKTYNQISMYNYESKSVVEGNKKNKIAVIFANGTIVDGSEMAGMAAADSIAENIRQARLDKKVKAVILRINSPGGSVSAAEVIRDELLALRSSGKPLIVSMGGLAASGGYWISTPADYVIASPTTLTGSIGIFGVINTFEETLGQLGVYSDGVSTSPLADIDATKKLPAEFATMMQLTIEHGYQRFLSIVADARKKTPEQIDNVAQGRVWLGTDALAQDLVDSLGDFDNAVEKAVELAKMPHYELEWYVESPSLTDLLFNQLSTSVGAYLPQTLQNWLPQPWKNMLQQHRQQLDTLSVILTDPHNRYAVCLSCTVTP